MSRRAWFAFAAMSVLWGCSYLLIRIAVRGGMPAADVAWTRVCIAAVILLGAVLAGRACWARVHGRWRWLIVYAVAEIAIPFPLIAAGEVHVASSLAAILIAAVPLIGAVLALRFDHAERPTRIRAIGLGIGFAGVIALVGVDIAGNGSELLGAGAILIAAVGYSIGPMLVKHRLGGLDPRVMMGASLAVAMLILTPFAAVDVPSRAPTIGAWASVAGAWRVLHSAGVRRVRGPDPGGRNQPRDRDHLRQPGRRGCARRDARGGAAGGGGDRRAAADPGRLVAVDRGSAAAVAAIAGSARARPYARVNVSAECELSVTE